MSSAAPSPKSTAGASHFKVDEAWLALRDEPVLEADLPIVDAHHHLWQKPHLATYLAPQLAADLDSGHNVLGTVFMQCASMYRAHGDPRFGPVGEIEFANGIAAMFASGGLGTAQACAGIVGHVDLTLGAFAEDVLAACIAAAPDRFRGIRHITAWDESREVNTLPMNTPSDLMQNGAFREGLAAVGRLGLSFDAYVYHPQLRQLAALVDAFPYTPFVLNHLGGYAGVGPYASRRDEVFREWRDSIRILAERPNVSVKLGGIGMPLSGFGFEKRDLPPTSAELAEPWTPFVHTCIDAFGPDRAMFESNFPVDKSGCSYKVLWNAFKRMAAPYSATEKRALFAGTAIRTYRLEKTLAHLIEPDRG